MSDQEPKSCEGKTCTCGIGPWSSTGACDHCGGLDLGVAWLPFELTQRPAQLTEDDVRKIAREEATKVIERMIDYAERRGPHG